MQICHLKEIEKYGGVSAFFVPEDKCLWKDPKRSAESWKKLAEQFDISLSDIIRPSQTHTSAVRFVTKQNGGEGILKLETESGFDGIAANEKKLMLCTLEADCVPVYLYDPVQKAAAMVHSGWKGTAGKISENAVKVMAEKFGTKAENLIAATGPCICPDCYEVSAGLLPRFEEKFSREETAKIFTPKENGKYLLNLPFAIRLTLEKLGVKRENVSHSEICTFHSGVCPSFRKGCAEERMLTGIMLL
ncbi:MAG: peptidoglycan editing factor PgeF [Synergistaceae bacterium]|nr:peptidoglycan editing factor PgeF [Synergistaceae bacterium]